MTKEELEKEAEEWVENNLHSMDKWELAND